MRPEKVANFINNSKTAQKILKGVNKNPAIYASAASFIFAAGLRPATMELQKKNFTEKKDKQYSQASSIAAGITDLIGTALIFIPLNKAINKASTKLTADVFQNSKAVDQFKSITNRVLKVGALIPISLARFSIVRPIVDTLFGKEDANGNPSGKDSLVSKLLNKIGGKHDK